jgi:hypothetical protein
VGTHVCGRSLFGGVGDMFNEMPHGTDTLCESSNCVFVCIA